MSTQNRTSQSVNLSSQPCLLAIDILPECVFCTTHRPHAEEKRSSMLVQAAIFAPKTTATKTSTAKGGATR